MGVEYIKFSYPEKVFGQKNLLQTQLEILNSLGHLKKYKNLRSEELSLKVLLKNKIEESIGLISGLDKMLPEVKSKVEDDVEEEDSGKIQKDMTFEDEIMQIQDKIRRLQVS